MDATIDVRLFTNLADHLPDSAAQFPITHGMTVGQLIKLQPISVPEAKLIFIDGNRAQSNTRLHGGERVGVFPPVGRG